MKKKVINIVEIILLLAALVILLTMSGDTQYRMGDELIVHQGVHIIRDIMDVPVYPVLLLVFWGLTILLCVFSLVSKSKKRASVWHGLLPIITIAVTDMCILGMASAASNFFLLNGVMLAVIIIGFAKRESFFTEE